jgi:hypothetical protein
MVMSERVEKRRMKEMEIEGLVARFDSGGFSF